MSFLDELRAARAAAAPAWLQFTRAYKADRPAHYLFLEGRLDVPFYISAIRSVFGGESQILSFSCGGKSGVLETRGKVRKSHPGCHRCLFFVDKDLSDLLGETDVSASDTFSTDTYSVENYFVSEEALQVVWTEIWGLSHQDPGWERARRAFLAALRQFHRQITPPYGVDCPGPHSRAKIEPE